MSTNRTITILWAAGAAATAGIVAVAVAMALKAKDHAEVSSGRRDIEDMIAECSDRIKSLEDSISGAVTAT